MNKLKRQRRPIVKTIYYSREELGKLEQNIARSAYKSLGEYVRRVSLNQPVKIIHRNASLDMLIDELIKFRREMEIVRVQLPTSDATIHQLIQLQQAAKETINKIADLCMVK